MTIAFESDGQVLSNRNLFLRGIGFLLVLIVIAGLLIARSEGVFRQTVRITALLVDVGDGLPPKSDVKFQGVLVGAVDSVTPSTDGGANSVQIELLPGVVAGIPDTVTARVVPSNVFAVPSVQLLYNGPAPALASGAKIAEDRSLSTVRLQTSLTALGRIVAAAGRPGSDPTLGILTAVERATAGRGGEVIQGGAELSRIATALDQAMAPDGTRSTLDALVTALAGLESSAPDLLGAVHNAVAPLQVVAQRKEQLTALLTGGMNTSGTIAAALEHNTGTITDITSKLSPALDVMSRGNYTQMAVSETILSRNFAKLWNPQTQNITAKIILELSPHRPYTRADCPRYANLAGPSCATGPAGGPTIIGPHAAPASDPAPLDPATVTPAVDPDLVGGNVGAVGSKQERDRVAALFGDGSNSATDLLVGPLLRGNDVRVAPAPDAPAPGGAHP
jgi:ABC-type transporter Mla subunit MlaD